MLQQKKVFMVIVVIQLVIVFSILYSIYIQSTTTSVITTPLNKKTITISSTNTLKYFFEPKPNKTLTEIYYQRVFLSTAPHYTINKDTLNERFNYAVKKEKKTFRIITLGDSFTYGHYVNTKDNWTEILEDILQTCSSDIHFEVINLAVPNYDIRYSVERFKKRGIKYMPDLVIWFVKDDDFAQINEITLPEKRKDYDNLYKNGALEKNIQKGEYWPSTTKAVKQLEAQYTHEQILTQQLQSMLLLNTYYSGNLLVFSPLATNNEYKTVIETVSQKRENTYLYLDFPSFATLPDTHPSSDGHREIAENIYRYLLEKKLTSCNE